MKIVNLFFRLDAGGGESRDDDPNPVGFVDFSPAGSGSVTFFIRSGSGSYK